MPVFLPPFDPSRAFKALAFFRFDGVIYERGSVFPSERQQPTERQTRLLYENRKIGYSDVGQMRSLNMRPRVRPPSGGSPIEPRDPALDTPPPSDEEMIADLVERHTQAKLWEMVQQIEADQGVELGVKKSDNKPTLAGAIVKAGNGPA